LEEKQLSEGLKMKKKLSALPNFFTLSNLFLGYLAILFIMEGRFTLAAIMVIFSAIADDLDGRMARWTKTYSNFGKELDSIVDAISFGVVPALLVFKSNFADAGPWAAVFCFLYVLATTFRLARFNVITSGFGKSGYKGLPAPVAALTLTTFILFKDHYWGSVDAQAVYLVLLPFISLLMVSNIYFEIIPELKFKRSIKANLNAFLFYGGFVMVIFFPKQAFFPWSVLYILKNLLTALVDAVKPGDGAKEISLDDDKIVK